MAPALVTLLLLSWIGLAAVLGLGYAGAWGLVAPVRHVHLAIPAFILGTLAHAMSMFYFIGTGKVIREAVAEYKLDPAWTAEVRRLRARTFPWALWAILGIMITSILGGAVDTARMPGWIHGVLGLITLVVTTRAVVVEVSCISRNLTLMDQVEAAIAGGPADQAAISADPVARRIADASSLPAAETVAPGGDRQAGEPPEMPS